MVTIAQLCVTAVAFPVRGSEESREFDVADGGLGWASASFRPQSSKKQPVTTRDLAKVTRLIMRCSGFPVIC
jgi:hypothetical protein